MFAGAARYHSGGIAGLRPGEVPAILQKGELVIPKITAGSIGAGTGGGKVEIVLGDGLEARFLDKAAAQSVTITRSGMKQLRGEVPAIAVDAQRRRG